MLLSLLKNKFISYLFVCACLFACLISGEPRAEALDVTVPVGGDINAAINLVSASGGGNVNLTSGTYTLTSSILLNSNVTLNGQGSSTIIQGPTRPPFFTLISTVSEGLSNITVNNLVLDGRMPRSAVSFDSTDGNPWYPMFGILVFGYTYWYNNVTFSNLEIKNTAAEGIHTGLCNGITISHCYVHDNGNGFAHNIYLILCNNMVVDHTISDNSTLGDGIHVSGGTGLTINKCEFNGNQGIGIFDQNQNNNQTIQNNLIQYDGQNNALQNNGQGGLQDFGSNLLITQDRFEYNYGDGALVVDPSSGLLGNDIGLGNSGDQFWTHINTSANVTSLTPNVYEAERGDGATGPTDTADWITTDSGYSGAGAVDFNTNHSANGALTFSAVSVPTTKTYPLVFRYSNGSGAAAALALTINGVPTGNISFPATADSSTWSTVTVNKALISGGNSIKVTVLPGSVAPVLDYLQVNTATPSLPAAPTGMTATAVSSQEIDLSWNAVSGAGSYLVERNLGTTYVPIATVTGTTYNDTHVELGGTTNSYLVAAINAAGTGNASVPASATSLMGIPAIVYATSGYQQVALQVMASAGATSYNLKRATVSGGPYTTIASVPNTGSVISGNLWSNYTDTTGTPGTPYYYVFSAVGPSGESGNSYEVTATPSFVPNGSFETPSVGTSSYQYNPSGGSWTFSGSSGIQSNGSGWQAANAPDGTQTAFIQGVGGAVPGSISQTMTFPAAGTYILSFQGAQRLGQMQPLKFSVDGVQVGSLLTPSSSSFAALTSALFTISSAGSHTITLSATDNSSDKTTLVDSVTITTISIILPPTANAQSITTNLYTSVGVTLSGADPNTPALPLTYAVTTAPAHGTLSGTAPNLTYTPTTGYTGSDSFQFKVSNGTLSSSVATVSITVNNASGIINGSFETPSVGTANYQYNPTGGTWAFLGDSGIQSNGSGWGVPNAPDGTQTAFLNGNPNRGTNSLGTILQNVNFATTGTYVVSFQAAQRYGQVQPLKLSVDGVQVGGLLTPTSSAFGTLTSGVFTINTTGSHTITISATATTSDLTTMVDSVTITPVTVATSSFANSSFETPSVGTANYQYSPTGASWTFLGDSGIQSNGSGWGVPNAPDGTQTAFLNGNPNRGTGNLGGISQSVNFASTGTYVVSFQAAQRYGQVQPLKLTVDGVQVGGLLTPTSSSFGTLTSGVFSISTTGLHTITISATATTSDLTTVVDSVTLTPVTVATSSFANSSFETPSVGTASYQYSPSGTSWTFLGDSGIQSNGSGWGVPNAPDGTQTAFLNGNPNRGTGNLGGISQSVNFASTGNYTISFQAAQRYGQVQPLKLTVDGVQVGGLLTPTSSAFGTLTSGVFTINTVGLHTITLSATATTSDLTSMVDQMALNAQ